MQQVRGMVRLCVSGTDRREGGKPVHDRSAHSVYVCGMSWIERAFLQHVGSRQALKRTVGVLVELLKADGVLYSLMIASEGMAGSWGISRWSRGEIRRALEPEFVIDEMYLDVFTPGETGSVPAWITMARPGPPRCS